MKEQDLSINPDLYVSGCGCPSCCSSVVDYEAQDAAYDASSYVRSSISQFSEAILADSPSGASSPAVNRSEANPPDLQSDGVSVLPLAAVQSVAGDSVPLAATQATSAIAFSDVTQSAGLQLPTQTWGSAVGDYDGDGDMDIWLNRHQQSAILYQNQGDGTFIKVTDSVFAEGETKGDFHGAAFIDINNDGTQDLLQSAGGDQGAADDNPNKQKKLFINTNGQLRDQANALGVEYLTGRGRINAVSDFNGDGSLDYFFTGPNTNDGESPATLFLQQSDGTFLDVGASGVDTAVPSGTFGIVSDLTGDGNAELIYAANTPKLQIYEISANPNSPNDVSFTDISEELLAPAEETTVQDVVGNATVQDVVVGDFNGDARQDLFIVRQGSSTSGVRVDSNRSGRTRLLISKSMQRGIELTTSGNLSLNFQGDPSISLPQFMQGVGISPGEIKIGASGRSPDSLVFDLNVNQDQGLPTYTPGGDTENDQGVFIGYEDGRWKILLSNDRLDEVNFLYESSAAIEDITAVNFPLIPERRLNTLLINTTDGFVDQTVEYGLDEAITASNAVSGDFDNDGHLDIYVVATDLTSNRLNILYRNKGDGTFEKLENAAGAGGTLIPGGDGTSTFGIGDGVSTIDYDNDGDLDLYVTNGDVAGFRRPFLIDGSPNLFQNNQNTGNHWVLLQLEGDGVTSNRDAIGARVEVTAGGTTQIREQNGGIHNRSQNDKRLHFGLGQNTLIDQIKIYWPGGREEIIENVAVDDIYTIVEGSGVAVGVGPRDETGKGGNNPGKQIIEGTSASDTLMGASGKDVIRGRSGNDSLSGLDGNDNLLGGAGQDSLDGGNGNDLIVGGKGRDVLVGGAGQDKFLFIVPGDNDVVSDFNPSEDMIRLRAERFGGGLTAGDLDAGQFHIGESATLGSHRVIYNSATGALLFDSDGSGVAAATNIATLSAGLTLSADEIKLV